MNSKTPMQNFKALAPFLACGCLLGAFTVGCGSVNTVSTRAPGKSASSVPQFDQINDALNSIWLSASDVRVAAAPSGVRTAQVDVANNDFRTRHFSYRFEWSDGSGMMIESQTNVWQNGAIPSGGMLTITSVAPNINAANFKLMVRRSD